MYEENRPFVLSRKKTLNGFIPQRLLLNTSKHCQRQSKHFKRRLDSGLYHNNNNKKQNKKKMELQFDQAAFVNTAFLCLVQTACPWFLIIQKEEEEENSESVSQQGRFWSGSCGMSSGVSLLFCHIREADNKHFLCDEAEAQRCSLAPGCSQSPTLRLARCWCHLCLYSYAYLHFPLRS